MSHEVKPTEVVPDGWVHPLDLHSGGSLRAEHRDLNGLPPYDIMPFRMPTPIPGGARMPTFGEIVFDGLRTGIASKPRPQDKPPQDKPPQSILRKLLNFLNS